MLFGNKNVSTANDTLDALSLFSFFLQYFKMLLSHSQQFMIKHESAQVIQCTIPNT